jgi:hypothetical protein
VTQARPRRRPDVVRVRLDLPGDVYRTLKEGTRRLVEGETEPVDLDEQVRLHLETQATILAEDMRR